MHLVAPRPGEPGKWFATTNARNRALTAKKPRFLTAVHTLLSEQDEEWMIAKIYLTMKP